MRIIPFTLSDLILALKACIYVDSYDSSREFKNLYHDITAFMKNNPDISTSSKPVEVFKYTLSCCVNFGQGTFAINVYNDYRSHGLEGCHEEILSNVLKSFARSKEVDAPTSLKILLSQYIDLSRSLWTQSTIDREDFLCMLANRFR
jgi:hypothetical protein